MVQKNLTHITKLTIENFRMIQKVTIEPSKRLNIITGKNGTAKSTVLGMVAQGFSFNNLIINYDSLNESDVKNLNKAEYEKLDTNSDLSKQYRSLLTILGDRFESISSDHFKLSKKDARGLKHCEVELSTGEKFEIRSTQHNDRANPRFVTRRGEVSSNYVHPVIYLGLDRLSSLVKSKNLKNLTLELSDNDKKQIHSIYEEILLKKYDENFSAAETDLRSKKTASFFPEDRTIEMISSGEDNVGQILLALYSFKKLKETYKEEYKGGILLIDEVDATLYPAAQNKLIEKLLSKALEYDIQIFLTTHSLSLLEHVEDMRARESRFKNQIKIFSNVLSRDNLTTNVIEHIYPLKNELLVQAREKRIIPTVNFYVEDTEAEYCLNSIITLLNKSVKKRIKFKNQVSMGCTQYKALYDLNVPEFKFNSIVCLDGDEKFNTSNMKNFISLPFDKMNPESFIFNILDNDRSHFWDKVKEYSYPMFMNNKHYGAVKSICDGNYEETHMISQGGIYQNKKPREVWKMWFKEEKVNWKGNNNPIKFWVSSNDLNADLNKFSTRLNNVFNYVAKNLKIEGI